MIHVWFRFKDEMGMVYRQGLACAQDKVELFWEIDQHGDPYEVEIASVRRSGSLGVDVEEDAEGTTTYSEVELGQGILDSKLRWKTPRWPDHVVSGQQEKGTSQ